VLELVPVMLKPDAPHGSVAQVRHANAQSR
jgi:hypothetical protein